MEKIRDLLNPVNDNLPVHEDRKRGVYVKDLTEVYVSSVKEVFDIMKQGTESRVVASTNMNEQSSRSHSLFILNIQQKNRLDQSCKTGKLSLVDLAGSEKVGKTGVILPTQYNLGFRSNFGRSEKD
jgi:kinesin family protein 5